MDPISLLTNPFTYLIPVGYIAAMYTGWSLARRQYLGVDKLFNLISLALLAGWATAFIAQAIQSQSPLTLLSWEDVWVHPRPLIFITGYIGLSLIASRYVRTIRYPYWRTIDMLAISLTVFQMLLVFAWLISSPSIGSIVATVGIFLLLSLLLFLYFKIDRPGITTAVHIIVLFAIVAATRYLTPSWQESTSGVEWVADGIGIAIGLFVLVLRISTKSEKVMLQDIPRGVSQSFQETFTRAFKNKPLAKKGSSATK